MIQSLSIRGIAAVVTACFDWRISGDDSDIIPRGSGA